MENNTSMTQKGSNMKIISANKLVSFICMFIWQFLQKGHNIFSKLSSSEYKQVLSYVKHCILATDLALFFPNKAKLSQLVADKTFSWGNSENR